MSGAAAQLRIRYTPHMQLVTETQVMSEATPTESGVEPLPGFWSVAHIFSIIGTFNFLVASAADRL